GGSAEVQRHGRALQLGADVPGGGCAGHAGPVPCDVGSVGRPPDASAVAAGLLHPGGALCAEPAVFGPHARPAVRGCRCGGGGARVGGSARPGALVARPRHWRPAGEHRGHGAGLRVAGRIAGGGHRALAAHAHLRRRDRHRDHRKRCRAQHRGPPGAGEAARGRSLDLLREQQADRAPGGAPAGLPLRATGTSDHARVQPPRGDVARPGGGGDRAGDPRRRDPLARGGDADRRLRHPGPGLLLRPVNARSERAGLADGVLVVVTAIWGASFVVVQDAVRLADPFTFLVLRFVVGASVLTARDWRALADRRLLLAGLGLGALLFLGFITQTAGLQYTTPSRSGVLTGPSVLL